MWITIKLDVVAHLFTNLAGQSTERHCLESVITGWGYSQNNSLQYPLSDSQVGYLRIQHLVRYQQKTARLTDHTMRSASQAIFKTSLLFLILSTMLYD